MPGLKFTSTEAGCSSYLMLHNKLPKIDGIEQPFIIRTDSGSGFQTGHSGDGFS